MDVVSLFYVLILKFTGWVLIWSWFYEELELIIEGALYAECLETAF